MRRLRLLPIAALCALTASSALVAQSPPLTPFRGLIDHVSADPWGFVSGSAEVWHRAISGDGRYVVMISPSSDLAADDYGDYNGYDDIFLRDRMTGTTTRISAASDGGSGDGISGFGTISTNGRHVAFASGSSNLVPGDTNGQWDVFVRDLDQQLTVRVSLATDGTQGDQDSYYPSLSADGRFVAFVSWASTFAPGVSPNDPRQIYLHDRDADSNGIFDEAGGVTTELISAGLTGGIADASVDSPRVTADGRHVLFESMATNLSDVGNANAMNHLYLRDRTTGQTALIDRAMTGGPSSWGVGYGTSEITDDGRFITFSSVSPDIVWLDMNWQSQVFLYDTVAGPTATTIVTKLPDGTLGDGSSYASSLSADGRYVLFTSAASNLASPPPGASGPAMLAVRDMLDGSFTRVDVLEWGDGFDESDYYYTPSISADGTAVVLHSRSQYALAGGYGWGAPHAFVVTAFGASPESASFPMEGGSGAIEVNTSAVSGWKASTYDPWIFLVDGEFGAGPRTLHYEVSSNSAGVARDGSIRVGSKTVWIHQEGDGDTTPPILTPTVTGTQVNGWYTSDITVTWSIEDPDSEIVSQFGCYSATFTTDFLDAQPFCEATSHGGTASANFHLRRDTTAPTIAITAPAATVYSAGSIVTPSFSCNDPYSGTASCAITEGSSPLDTTPGWHTFTVTATDNVGNSSTKSVQYLVGTGVCVAPNDSLAAWFRFEDDTFDALERMYAFPTPVDQTIMWFAQGVAGRSWQAQPQTRSYLETSVNQNLLSPWQSGLPAGLTVAAWVRPTGAFGESATIVAKPALYRIARYPDGTLRWAFSQTTGYDWVNTGVVIPLSVWSHVAVTYDDSLVKTYVNGILVHTQQLAGTLTPSGDFDAPATIGGRGDVTASLFGWLDDVQFYTSALTGADVDALARAGDGSTCLPKSTTVEVSVPATVGFGPTYPATATLRDSDGNPIANKWVNLFSYVSPGGAFAGNIAGPTDVNGQVSLNVPMASSASLGTYASGLHAAWDGDAHHTPSSAAVDITVVRGTPTLGWPSPAAITYGTPLAAQLTATANTPGTFTYSPAPGAILGAGTHTLSVTFTPADGDRWNAATATTTLVVNKAAPVITVTAGTFTYDMQPHAATASATGVLGEALSPVTVLYNGSTTTPPTDAGTYIIVAQYAGSANYTSAFHSATQLRINKFVPIVTITGGPFTYNAQPRPATVVIRGCCVNEYLTPSYILYNGGSTVPVNAGTHTVTVNYGGSWNYEAVTAGGSLIINKATPTVTPNVVSNVTATYDGQPHGIGLTPSVQGVNFTSLSPVVVTYDGSTVRPTNAGQYLIEVRYDGSTNYNAILRTATLTILKATPALTWPAPAGIVYGAALSGSQLNASSPVAGTFSYSPEAGTVLNAGSHALAVTLTPADAANYNNATANVTLDVAKAPTSISWPAPADIVYGTALGAQLNATANVPGALSYSPAAGTVLNAGTHTLSATFTPDDAANYNGSSVNVSINVNKAPASISWATPADIVYGAALDGSQLNATANVPGTFSYSPASGAALNAGSHTLSVTFAPDDAANYNGASANVSLTVTKAASTINWSNPADIVYGTALGAAQLNATANVAGTFSYSPAAGVALNAGSHTLSVTFTPDDAANYHGSSANVSLTVTKAASTINWSNPADIVYGGALGAAQLNATANVPGTFSYSPASGTALNAGSHTLSVAFTPDDAANYNGSSANVTLSVAKAGTTVSWSNPAGIVYGTALSAAQLNATASVPGSFAYSPAVGAVLGAGTRDLSVTFTPADAANYESSSAAVSIAVAAAALTVQADHSTKVYGQALPSFTAGGTGFVNGDSMASLSGTLAFSTSATAASAPGSYAVTPAGVSSANYTITFAAGTLTVNKASTSLTLTTTPNPSNHNQQVQLRAVVSAVAPGAGTATGTVEFRENGTLLGTATLVNGVATMNKNFKRGTHPLTATYAGSTNFTGSSGSVTHQTP